MTTDAPRRRWAFLPPGWALFAGLAMLGVGAFLKLTSETKQRDAQLASLQQQHEAQLRALSGATAPISPTPVTQPTLGAGQPIARVYNQQA